jgi:hypothetical protein
MLSYAGFYQIKHLDACLRGHDESIASLCGHGESIARLREHDEVIGTSLVVFTGVMKNS